MSNLLYTLAVILVVFWAIGFHSAGGIIHVLLVIAIIAILRLIKEKDYKISILVKIKKKI
jgi:succinate dehydrogenase/fumarate reductase cytochrome b subunit